MNNTKKLITSTLLFISLISIIGFYLTGHISQKALFHSDALYLPTLFSDIFAHQGKISDWFLTPAPYFFPDFLLFFFAYMLSAEVYRQIIIFSLIQISLTWVGLWLLSKQITSKDNFTQATTLIILFIYMALRAGSPFVMLAASAHHYGIFIAAIFFAGLWLQYQKSSNNFRKKTLLVMLSLIAFLSTLSDNFFLIQVIAPFLATAFLFDIKERNFTLHNKVPILIPVILSIFGAISYKFIVENYTRYYTNFAIQKFHLNLGKIISIFHISMQKVPFYSVLFFLYLAIVIYVLASLFKSHKRNLPHSILWLVVFSFFSVVINVLVLCFITNLPIASRYFIPALSWPIIIVVLVLAYYSKRGFFLISTFISLILVTSLCVNLCMFINRSGLSPHFYNPEVACIDHTLKKEGLNNGISQYWDAKYLQQFSKLHLNMAQHNKNLTELYWITSKQYFKNSYDFAIISEKAPPPFKISVLALLRINGSPKEIISCGSRTIYVYGKNKLHVVENTH